MDVELARIASRDLEQSLKRLGDVIGAAIGLIVLAPALALIGVLITIDSPGAALYCQERVGRGGERFGMLKFRTMRQDAHEELEPCLRKDWLRQAEYDRYQKLADDPRLTRVGRLLRRTSLDELPQLWNVLKGEMSLVGPRPLLPEQIKRYGRAYRYYAAVRPGLTGLWQVSGRNQLSFEERARLDEKYVQEWSIGLDVGILLRTPWAVISQRGAY